MKLFGIKDIRKKTIVRGVHFGNKAQAKEHRDQLNEVEPETYVVTPGPDHRAYKGEK